MADDGSGVGSSSEKEYVAGCETRNAFVSSNALRVTQPATYFQNKNMFVSLVEYFVHFQYFLCFFLEVWQELEEVERDRQPL